MLFIRKGERETGTHEEEEERKKMPLIGLDKILRTLESRIHIYMSDYKEERENTQRTGDPDVMISL
jgi:hypothetical protein